MSLSLSFRYRISLSLFPLPHFSLSLSLSLPLSNAPMMRPNLDDADPGRLECGKRKEDRKEENSFFPSSRTVFFLLFLMQPFFLLSLSLTLSLSLSFSRLFLSFVLYRKLRRDRQAAALLEVQDGLVLLPGVPEGPAGNFSFERRRFFFLSVSFSVSFFASREGKEAPPSPFSLSSLPVSLSLSPLQSPVPLALPPRGLQAQRLRRRH